jgi:hypothetical protein
MSSSTTTVSLGDMWSRAFAWDHITRDKLLALGAVVGTGYVYIFDLLGSLDPHSTLLRAHDACLLGCPTGQCVHAMRVSRDRHYYPKKRHEMCAFTAWELTHLLFHVGVGYYFNLPVSLLISVGFELYEHFFRDCGSFMDVFWNGLGCLLGLWLSIYY